MAEPDHGNDSGLTPEDSSTGETREDDPADKAVPAKPEKDTGTPETDTGTPEKAQPPAPVKSAPLRRRPGKKKSPKVVATGTPESGAPESGAPEPGAVEAATPEPGGAESGQAESGTVEPDPSDVEKTVGYRARRQTAGGVTPKTPAPKTPAPDTPAPAQSAVQYSGASKGSAKWIVISALAAVVAIAASVVAMVFGVGIHNSNELDERRAEYSAFATQMIVNLTTLNKDNAEEALKVLETKTSGKARQQMDESMKQAVGLVREQNLNTRTTILSDAVTKAEPTEGSVIVVYGWQMDPAEEGGEMELQTFRWRVDITRINGELKMTNFEWVT